MVYIDTSVILSKLFKEPTKFKWNKLKGQKLLSSSLIYYETMSACKREGIKYTDATSLLKAINIVSPNKILEDEVAGILEIGYLRGADLTHLATALWLSRNEPKNLVFLSFDNSQLKVARELGFEEL